ncbi:MAG: bifunctional 5,10-methylenetetrahydrofolate dehydrogenase/5,10-methenyltetrahydrofolate cyclohydrolase [Lachnospiraceae bacterium]|nr:bifunctional 5,10-methylenetetrahydrofolate dehydrogenase/5,10-methenyltetrahydrofolate cyclohydrolase [Lachnospiraceae bacterium]
MGVLKGIEVAKAINEEIAAEMRRRAGGKKPHLAIIRVGEKPDDMAYERGAIKKMEKVGFVYSTFTYPADISNRDFLREFDQINEDTDIDGILLLRPLPKQIDETEITERISPAKDIDGISPYNMAKIYAGEATGFAPCTAEAVIEMLDHAGVDLTGKRVTVIGRSLVIGKPVMHLLIKRNATVTVCHTRTEDIPARCREADILVAAAGVPKMVDASYIKEGAVVIDVGINVDEDGNLCGDVDFDAVADHTSLITPVPGGVGSVTTSVLAKHLLRAAHRAAE